MTKKNIKKLNLREDVVNLYFNRRLTAREIAEITGKSIRTIYRWLNVTKHAELVDPQKKKPKQIRKKKYHVDIFIRIKELKEELPVRTAVHIQRIIQKEYPHTTPSISTIRKYLADHGYSKKNQYHRKGYIVFERSKPNDLWQIDIAGVQTIGHLGKLYLIALLDDCSRFIPAAFYAKDEKTMRIIALLRQAFIEYGRPNQILADNGTQFKNVIGELRTRYSRLLRTVGVEPIFARPRHPQTKGKLERWFGTVNQMFLLEARYYVKQHLGMNLSQFNEMFQKWLQWYNFKKPHRSLPQNCAPAKIYFKKSPRIYRPLEIAVNWDRWMAESFTRKVTKTNFIAYEGVQLAVPPGYAGMKIEVLHFQDRIELYNKENKLITHPRSPIYLNIGKKGTTRKIAKNGTIGYGGIYYSIDYKLRGESVNIQESNSGELLLIYLKDKLIKSIQLKKSC